MRSAAQAGKTGCPWAERREAAVGRNYGGEACGRGSGPASASTAPERTRAGEGLEAKRCGVHVSEKPLVLGEDGPGSPRAGGPFTTPTPHSPDRTAGVGKPTAATPEAGVSAVAPASF